MPAHYFDAIRAALESRGLNSLCRRQSSAHRLHSHLLKIFRSRILLIRCRDLARPAFAGHRASWPCGRYSRVVTTDLDSRKHGIGASQLAVRPEEIHEFNRCLAGLYADMRPSGEIQRLLFGLILHANWNMRIARIEEAKILLETGPAAPTLKALSQFYSKSERAFYKAVSELRAIQTELAYRATLADEQDAPLPDIPPLVRTALVHKQVRAITRGKTVLQTWRNIRRNQSSG